MQIFVKTLSGKMIALDVEVSYSVSTVRDKIREQGGVCSWGQHLMFAGNLLEDRHRLMDYGVRDECVIRMCPCDTKPMQIFVYTLRGTSITLDVRASDLVEDVKTKMEDKKITMASNECLTWAGKGLRHGYYLADYGITKECGLHISWSSSGRHYPDSLLSSIQLFVKTATGRTIILNVKPSDSVDSVKESIEAKESLPPDQQGLFLGTKQLETGHTLADYGIEKESVLLLVFRL